MILSTGEYRAGTTGPVPVPVLRYEGAAVIAEEYKATCKQLQDELTAMRKQVRVRVCAHARA